ncbi:MAG TPA: aminoacetone oxidase family FAD-binding enzyme [Candidatus Cryptobacteroides merdipullorum]|uniref:Aminoacetone oxidase family FAD-binding enzyme n=1 Tax=Candidatus Cryptobacteroides merdipullorum TaxID=2840771 RepID=A0A9D1KI43_9BACT|nr:aminoacetone oxidase family FAD-binding enzyme [Candidatus Cryptobacteroides merdipullorum]
MMKIAVIGGGAAGCFCAVEMKRRLPEADVTVYEAGRRPMAKLAVTGGGRCNITNTFEGVGSLAKVYPRGDKFMKRALKRFGPDGLLRWFEAEGVRFVAQPDGCVFPESQDAMQIVRTLEKLMRRSGVRLVCGRRCVRIVPVSACLSEESPESVHGGAASVSAGGFVLEFSDGCRETADKVVLTAGGSSSAFLRTLLPDTVEIVPTVPSLFTFRIADEGLRTLMGTVVDSVSLSIAGTAFRSEGTLLITDWGLSGPATLKLSSYAARYLSEHEYSAPLLVNWTGMTESGAREWISEAALSNPRRQLGGIHPSGLTARLWEHLLRRAGLKSEARWSDLAGRAVNRLAAVMTADQYRIIGRAAFKEEFVTCGGVSLSSVDLNTLECRSVPGLYFAGEVLDIDAITGGFNLQAAWSGGYVVAQAATT